MAVEKVGPFQVHSLYRFHRVCSQQVLPEFDGPVAFRFSGGVPDRIQQLTPQPPQLWEPFLHSVYLRQRLEKHLSVVPLPVLQGQAQRLRQVTLLGQHGRDPRVLVLVQTFHKVVRGIGINPDELHFQLLYPIAGHLPTQLPSQEPGHGWIDLVYARRNRFQQSRSLRRSQHGPARRVRPARGLHPAFWRQ